MGVPLTLSSVPAQTPYVQYVSGASQTVFPYPFEITQDSDLVCLINGVAQPTDGGYTLSGQGNTNGGNLTFTVGQTAGTIITLYRNISISRITQLSQNGTFFSANFNNEYNRIYLILQQLQQSLLPGGNQAFALMVPNSNSPAPTTLLTPAAYANKYLSFDSNGNPQPAVLTSSGSLTQSIISNLLTPPTPQEITANGPTGGVVNTAYLPGVIERYGNNSVPFTTSMTVAFQAAVNQARVAGGADVIVGTTGGILLDGAIDMTTPSGVGATRYAVTVRGVRNLQAVTNNSPYYGTILLKHAATAAFDSTGAVGVNFENLSIGTDPVTYPKICFLQARNADASSNPNTRFRNVQVLGNFKIAVLYNYGIEDDEYYGCQFWNFAQDFSNGSPNTGSKVMVFTGTNYLYGITSSFTTILGGGANHLISCQDHKFFGGTYYNNRGSANLSSVAITGVAGQFSCSASNLYVGQPVAITGTFGGGGSISGYVNPTVYFISATNGTTTFTLQTAAGAALTTTAGTPTGLTYAAQSSDVLYLESTYNFRMYAPWFLSAQVGVSPGRSIIYVDTKNNSTSNITIDAPMIENQAPNQQNFMFFIGNEGSALSAANTNYNVRGGGTSANIACFYNSAASSLTAVFWWQNSIQSTPYGLINDGNLGQLFSDGSLQQNGGGAGTFTRNIPLVSGPLGIQSPGDGYVQLNDPAAGANNKIWNIRNANGTFSATLATDANTNTSTGFSITRTGTTPTLMEIGPNLKLDGEIGFNNTNPIAKPTVSGSKGANAALSSLMTALSAYGLVIDTTT